MKTIASLLFVFFAFETTKGSEASPFIQVFQELQLTLAMDYLEAGKPLPSSFEEIPMVKEQAKSPIFVKNLNQFSIVTGAPLIKPEQGISPERSGCRLAVIVRTPNLEPEKLGRFTILVKMDGLRVIPSWIPEPEVQLILKQLGGYDPAKQPLVFPELDNQADKDGYVPNIKGRGREARTMRDRGLLSQIKEIAKKPSVSLWVIIGGVLLVLLAWFAIRKKRSARFSSKV